MNFFKQTTLLLRLNLLGAAQRLGLVCTTVVGVTCAVGVLTSMLAMGVGAQRAAMGNVRADRASVLSVDAVGPEQSAIPKDAAALVSTLPGIRRNAGGQPVAVPEALVFIDVRNRNTGDLIGFPITGAGTGLTDYVPELHLSAGRMFRPGLLELIASTYSELAAADVQEVNGALNFVSYFVGTILAVAATIGAANAMYTMVDSRRRELATLRAIGFRSPPLIASFLSESVLLAIPGALFGTGLAWLLFNGRETSSLNFQFHLMVTPSLALLGIGWALCIGLIGGALPAVRAAAVPVSAAMRAM